MRLSITAFVFALFFLGCPSSDDDSPSTPICGSLIQIVDDLPTVEDVPSSVTATIDGLCLTVTIGHSGCSSDPWTLELFTRGDIAESTPTQSQANLRFSDAGPGEDQLCLAVFARDFEFDLTPYLANALPSILRIEGTEIELLVE